jgi:hypothetical protein
VPHLAGEDNEMLKVWTFLIKFLLQAFPPHYTVYDLTYFFHNYLQIRLKSFHINENLVSSTYKLGHLFSKNSQK